MNPALKRVAAALAISAMGIVATQYHEGSVSTVYLDIAGVPTVCSGHTAGLTKQMVGQRWTEAQCAAALREDIAFAEAAVRANVIVPLTQEQYDALVDFTFNLGPGALASSTMLRLLNAGDCVGAADAMLAWDKARVNGQLRSVKGLTVRRWDNRNELLKGC